MSKTRKRNSTRRHAAGRSMLNRTIRGRVDAECETIRSRHGFVTLAQREAIDRAVRHDLAADLGHPSPRPARLGE